MRKSGIQEQWSNWLVGVLVCRRSYFFLRGSAPCVCTVCTWWLSGLHLDSRRRPLQRATQVSFMEHLRPSRGSVAICRIWRSSWMGLSRPFSCLCTAPSLLKRPIQLPLVAYTWVLFASTVPGQYQSFHLILKDSQRLFWHKFTAHAVRVVGHFQAWSRFDRTHCGLCKGPCLGAFNCPSQQPPGH